MGNPERYLMDGQNMSGLDSNSVRSRVIGITSRHKRIASAALGALALTSGAAGVIDVGINPLHDSPARYIGVGRLAITLTSHDAFKTDTCSSASVSGSTGSNDDVVSSGGSGSDIQTPASGTDITDNQNNAIYGDWVDTTTNSPLDMTDNVGVPAEDIGVVDLMDNSGADLLAIEPQQEDQFVLSPLPQEGEDNVQQAFIYGSDREVLESMGLDRYIPSTKEEYAARSQEIYDDVISGFRERLAARSLTRDESRNTIIGDDSYLYDEEGWLDLGRGMDDENLTDLDTWEVIDNN
ncbi:hypothetical protein [Mycobacterium marinum]|uniref:hypothetical protein n=1 Tax=Mycobacterium marinum TaxID=1781 RepID=UPI0019216CFD|nr:hypothetical protein [Mycobacterium marinum]QQW35649.1 hypothetical protein HXW97_18775 [Mycobacterium marinum]